MKQAIRTLLLTGLPTSRMCHILEYLNRIPSLKEREIFHLGLPVYLSDFPYLDFMREIDAGLNELGLDGVYYHAQDGRIKLPDTWLALVELLNQDFADLVTRPPMSPPSAARYLFWRIDMAFMKVSGETFLNKLPPKIQDELADKLDQKAEIILKEKKANFTDTLEGKTVIIGFSRGLNSTKAQEDNKAFSGYLPSLQAFSRDILKSAAMLYIKADPKAALIMDEILADTNISCVYHNFPVEMLRENYNGDDIESLLGQAGTSGNIIEVKTDAEVFRLPVVIFDNQKGLTSFMIKNPDWSKHPACQSLKAELVKAFNRIWEVYAQ